MKKLVAFIIFLAVVGNFACAEVPVVEAGTQENGQLKVVVTNLEPSSGDVHIALFNSKKTFTKKSVKSGVAEVEKGKATWIVTDLPSGEYGIALFHDVNGDGKFNKNIIGLPKEGYGFSNNAKPGLGPPSWDDVKFSIKTGTNTHSIKVND